jgi:hypothetical protein
MVCTNVLGENRIAFLKNQRFQSEKGETRMFYLKDLEKNEMVLYTVTFVIVAIAVVMYLL